MGDNGYQWMQFFAKLVNRYKHDMWDVGFGSLLHFWTWWTPQDPWNTQHDPNAIQCQDGVLVPEVPDAAPSCDAIRCGAMW